MKAKNKVLLNNDLSTYVNQEDQIIYISKSVHS